jgi:hypothetical protein
MALVDCPECGHQVSDAAETCPSCGVRLIGQSAALQLQLELSQNELEWERERHRHMMHTKYGQEVVPKKWSAAVVAVFSIAGGIACGIWISSLDPVQNPAAPGIAIFVAGLVIVVGLGVSGWSYSKADAYEHAEAEYHRKKDAARSKYAVPSENQS